MFYFFKIILDSNANDNADADPGMTMPRFPNGPSFNFYMDNKPRFSLSVQYKMY